MSGEKTSPARRATFVRAVVSRQFHTDYLRLSFLLPLRRRTAAAAALLSNLLRRGTARHPDMVSLSRAAENLYGAAYRLDSQKMGDSLLLTATVQYPRPGRIPGGISVVRGALQLLLEILTGPRLEKGLFPSAVFEHEKRVLALQLEALVNARTSYSHGRFLRRFMPRERHRLFEYGDPDACRALTNRGTVAFWRDVIERRPLCVFSHGSLDEDALREALRPLLETKRDGAGLPLTHVCRPARRRLKRVSERFAVQDAHLWIGLRGKVCSADAASIPLAVANAMYGGLPTSRLFRNVRGRLGLAYDAHSVLVRTKGAVEVFAGVRARDVERTAEVALGEWEEVQAGRFGRKEFEEVRRFLLHQLRAQADSRAFHAHMAMFSALHDRATDLDGLLRSLRAVTPEAVADAALRVRPDTVFVMLPEEERGS